MQSLLGPLFQLVLQDARLEGSIIGAVEHGGRRWPIPRFVYRGPAADFPPRRLGIFSVVHGDEPAGAVAVTRLLRDAIVEPEVFRGLELYCYPVCNPTGLEDGTRFNRAGVDLNREFWRQSVHAEVVALEAELAAHRFDGLIALHADCDSPGLYAFARGSVITEELVAPALAAAEGHFPRNCDMTIDGFKAQGGVIRDCYHGVLSAPPQQSPAPFDIILETPGRAALEAQAVAAVLAIRGIVAQLPRLYSVAAEI